jgi:hypothetical protein
MGRRNGGIPQAPGVGTIQENDVIMSWGGLPSKGVVTRVYDKNGVWFCDVYWSRNNAHVRGHVITAIEPLLGQDDGSYWL